MHEEASENRGLANGNTRRVSVKKKKEKKKLLHSLGGGTLPRSQTAKTCGIPEGSKDKEQRVY